MLRSRAKSALTRNPVNELGREMLKGSGVGQCVHSGQMSRKWAGQ